MPRIQRRKKSRKTLRCLLYPYSSIWFDTMSLAGTLYISRGHSLQFPSQGVIQAPKIVFILNNKVNPDVMPHLATFHLGLYCLSKYLIMDFQYLCRTQCLREILK